MWTPDASRTNQILPSGDLDLRGSGSPRRALAAGPGRSESPGAVWAILGQA